MRYIIVLISIFHCAHLYGMSIVYNFRLAEITQPLKEESHTKNNKLVSLFFDQYQKTYNDIRQNFIGGLESYIYTQNPYFFRIDTAFASIHESIKHKTTFTDMQTDDILFTFGKSFFSNDQTSATFSLLAGIPTHEISDLEDHDIGFCQFSIGTKFDGEYKINDKQSLVWGGRYIYFIPRIFTILTQKYMFTNGNIANLLIGLRQQWKKHEVEAGYTFCSIFEPDIFPDIHNNAQAYRYKGSCLYTAYTYKYTLSDLMHEFLCNLSYCFEHKPHLTSFEYIVQFWISWSINF